MKTKKAKVLSLVLVVLMAAIMLPACGDSGDGDTDTAANGETIVLKLASDAPVEHIATQLNEEACEKVKERTDGRVEVQYYGASQLGGYETVYPELASGSIDIAQITVPDATDPRLGAAYLPFYALSFDEAKILYGKDSFMTQTFADLTKGDDVRFLGWVLEGFIGIGAVLEPTDALTPGTPKGIKLRTPTVATFRIPAEDLGYNVVTIPYAEVPTAIQTKVVDGWVGGTPNMNFAWVGDVINYMYVNYIHAEATCYVMSEKSLAKLSDEDQQIVVDVFNEQSENSFTVAQENEDVYKQRLADEKGVEVIELTPEQLKANADFVRDETWTKLENELTKELVDGFRAEIEKLNG